MGSDDVVDMNRRAWERVADQYNRRERVIVGALFGDFMASLPDGGRVLDVGSGTGLPYAGALVEQGFDVVGVDVSSRMVKLARGHVPGACFVKMSMTEMAYEEEFDGVLAVYSMLLLDPPLFRDVAGRVVGALRGGGVFYLVLNEPREEGADVDGEAVVEIMGEAMYSRGYSVGEVRGVFLALGLEEAGFRRGVHVTEEFGVEHMVEFLFRKPMAPGL
ncbi:MAG: class I SAM-dependent methyltransferase [Candidatus Bathyarchaeota archaeon]|nr:class I SAM-dependent methyltransferase [Candidatus Bathyarchaeota archaeon]